MIGDIIKKNLLYLELVKYSFFFTFTQTFFKSITVKHLLYKLKVKTRIKIVV